MVTGGKGNSEIGSWRAYESSSNNATDSTNLDPDYFDNLLIDASTAQASENSASDQSGYLSSHNEQDSDNVDPDFPEDGYYRR